MDAPKRTPTVERIVAAHPDEVIGARELIETVLGSHPEYGGGRAEAVAIPWPPTSGAMALPEEYLDWVAGIYTDDAFGGMLHGRAVVLGAALVDRGVGRAMASVGLFQAIADELKEDLESQLAPDGVDRYHSIPLARVHKVEPIVYPVSDKGPFAIGQSRDGRWVAVAAGDRVQVFRGSAPVLETILPESIHAVAVHAAGRSVVVGLESSWGVVTVSSGEYVPAAVAPTEEPTRFSDELAPTPGLGAYVAAADGSSVFASDGQTTDVRSLDHEGRVTSYTLPEAAMARLFVSPSARWLGRFTPDSRFAIVDTRTSETRYQEVNPPTGGLAVDDTGRLAYPSVITLPGGTTSEPGIQIGSKGTSGHLGASPTLAFSPDGRFVVGVGGPDNAIQILDASELGLVATIEQGFLTSQLTSLSFSGDGHWLLASDGQGTVAQWEVGLTPAPRPPAPLAYTADSADGLGDDLMGIDPEVDAFASLISARDLEPPLSIGVFGEWGSGKTFFMRRLKDRIEERSRTARESGLMQREVSFAKRIVQVEFNAWHYSGGNLWAALVQHIFENLSLFGGEPESEVAKRQRHILERMNQLDEKRTELLRDESVQEQAAKTKSSELEDLETKHQQKIDDLKGMRVDDIAAVLKKDATTRAQIAQLAEDLGLSTTATSAKELIEALQESRALLRRASPFFAVGRGRGTWQKRWALFGATLAGPATASVVELIVRAADWHLDGVAAAIAGVTALLGAGTAWVTKQNEWIDEHLTEAEQIDAKLMQRVRDAEAEYTAERAAIEGELAALTAELSAVRAEMARVESDRTALASQLEETTPARVLAEYILARADSDDYRKHLGLHARIKEDFDRIAQIIDEDRRAVLTAATLEAENRGADHRIDRIVLFVDDLDRCKPEKVVEVLRAVHLLLAFPLFVVVVGIDARWGSLALKKAFPDLLGETGEGSDAATPENFLEKIFQIPFWLRPLDADRAVDFVTGVVGGAPVPTPAPSEPSDVDSGGASTTETAATAPAAATQPPVATIHPPAPRPELNPESLRMGPEERTYVREVGPLLGSSPRAIKRFVNLYRLTKALASDPVDFITDRPGYGAPYQAVMILLALDTGMPEQSGELFEWLHGWIPAAGAANDLGTATTSTFVPGNRPPWGEQLHAWTRAERAEHRQRLNMQLLKTWAPAIARFSFRAAP